MANTVVGIFDDYSQAQDAYDELVSSGFSRDEVQLSPAANSSDARSAALRDSEQTNNQEDQGWSIGKFFSSLFGNDTRDDHVDVYSEAVRRGSYLLSVDADSDEQRDRAADIMNRYDPVDVDERASQWKAQGWSQYDSSADAYNDDDIARERTAYASQRSQAGTSGMQANEERIPVVEEQLKVGKRAVQSGGVRVFTRMTEKPVQESVQLREEHVKVERHAVDQPASEADLAAFKEGEIELRETSEEAVVSKNARVVEEVVLGKEVSERTETVNETLRRTDVEVEQLGAQSGGDRNRTMDDSDYRTHWQSAYGQGGGRYEDHAPAYQYGSELGNNQQYSGSQWNDIEPEARRDWESRNSGTPWEKSRDAVRYGWERRSR